MSINPVSAVATAISEVAKTIGTILATKRIRHLKAALDAAERYIMINEGLGDNKKLSKDRKKKLLAKMLKRFMRFN